MKMKVNKKVLWTLAAPAAFAFFAMPCTVFAQEQTPAEAQQAETEQTQSEQATDAQETAETAETADAADAAEEASADTLTPAADEETAVEETTADETTEEAAKPEAVQPETSALTETAAQPAATEEATAAPVESAQADNQSAAAATLPSFDETNTIDASTDAAKYKEIFANTTGNVLLKDVDLGSGWFETGNNVYVSGSVLLNHLSTTNAGIYGYDQDASKDVLTMNSFNAGGSKTTIQNVTLDMSSSYEGLRMSWSGDVTVDNSVILAENATGAIGCGLYSNGDANVFTANDSTLKFNNNQWCGIDTTNGNTNCLFRFNNCEVEINGNKGNGFQGLYDIDGKLADTPEIVFTNSNVQANDNGFGATADTPQGFSGFSYTTIALKNTDDGHYTFSASGNMCNGVGGHKDKRSALSADGYDITTVDNKNGVGIKQNAVGTNPVIENSTVTATGNATDITYANDVKPVFKHSDVTADKTDFGKDVTPTYEITIQFTAPDGTVLKEEPYTIEQGQTKLTAEILKGMLPQGYELPENFSLEYEDDNFYPAVLKIELTKIGGETEEKPEQKPEETPEVKPEQKPEEKPQTKPETSTQDKPETLKPADKTQASTGKTPATGTQTYGIYWLTILAGAGLVFAGLESKRRKANKD